MRLTLASSHQARFPASWTVGEDHLLPSQAAHSRGRTWRRVSVSIARLDMSGAGEKGMEKECE